MRVLVRHRQTLAYVFFTLTTVILFYRQDEIVRQRESDRESRVVAACHQDNALAAQARFSARNQAEQSARELIDQANRNAATQGKPPTNPEVANAYIAGQAERAEAQAKSDFPFRDCTAKGLAAFFSHPPPPVECEPDLNRPGYCL